MNYYIRINVKVKNGLTYSNRVCHIGRNNHLDFMQLYNFFRQFSFDQAVESNTPLEFTQLFTKLHDLKKKLVKNCVLAEDATNFRQFLFDLFASCLSDEFESEDEYGQVMTFQEIINGMATRHAEISFKQYEGVGYIMDGLYVDTSTGFL